MNSGGQLAMHDSCSESERGRSRVFQILGYFANIQVCKICAENDVIAYIIDLTQFI
jgi:hypothetical protein